MVSSFLVTWPSNRRKKMILPINETVLDPDWSGNQLVCLFYTWKGIEENLSLFLTRIFSCQKAS